MCMRSGFVLGVMLSAAHAMIGRFDLISIIAYVFNLFAPKVNGIVSGKQNPNEDFMPLELTNVALMLDLKVDLDSGLL